MYSFVIAFFWHQNDKTQIGVNYLLIEGDLCNRVTTIKSQFFFVLNDIAEVGGAEKKPFDISK